MAEETLIPACGPTLRSSSRSSRRSANPDFEPHRPLSTFERIISSHPPIFESLLVQLPTSSIISLYHTSECLRQFLQDYPTAWKTLSFRSPSPGRPSIRQNSPASDASSDSSATSFKPYSLDLLLLNIVLPFGTRLRSLELDHTNVAGESLAHCVLHARRDTLQHLSVRGCKQVSLKYHIVPFLTLFKLQQSVIGPAKASGLTLKSLYTFRCRHHRRRPYVPSSRVRKDSDSAPTHDLIQLCHELGIWTDSAWCPTLGGRCLRRKDYSSGRGTPEAKTEVWVVFDRLWRSRNRLGQPNRDHSGRNSTLSGILWQDAERGYDGEPLGCEPEGKGLPTHLRQSHRTFIKSISCHDCGTQVQERCEHCSIMMHCMGCRKTLCQDCAFSRPLPRATNHDRDTGERFWWAPSAVRSPNLMLQEIDPSTSPTNGMVATSTLPPPIKMQWCCLKPNFSNGGSINYPGPGLRALTNNQIRAVPLPRHKGYEDPEFEGRENPKSLICSATADEDNLASMLPESPEDVLQVLRSMPGGVFNDLCPRNLCHDCWHLPNWKAACHICGEILCFAHDFQGLNVRLCGYKDLAAAQATLEERSKFKDIMVIWEKTIEANEMPRDKAEDMFRKYLQRQALSSNSLRTLEAVIPLIKWPLAKGEALSKEINGLIRYVDTPSPRRETTPSSPDNHSLINEALASSPLEAIPQRWKGCGAFMCPQRRAVGDHRPKCTAIAKQCILCSVHVCPECLALKPACDCSFCKDHYGCPNCFHIQQQHCKKAEEEDKKRKAEEKILQLQAEGERLRERANELAQLVGEFMLAVDGDARNASKGEPSV